MSADWVALGVFGLLIAVGTVTALIELAADRLRQRRRKRRGRV